MNWKVKLYITVKGDNPVGEFLKRLSKKEEAKVYREIDLLEQKGIFLGFPHTSDIRGYKGLKELRIKFGSSNLRIFYFLKINNVFILLHGFRKKTGKLPIREIMIAYKRMKEYLGREG